MSTKMGRRHEKISFVATLMASTFLMGSSFVAGKRSSGLRRLIQVMPAEAPRSTAAAYFPLSFAPPEAHQIVNAAHVRLCQGRILQCRLIWARPNRRFGANWTRGKWDRLVTFATYRGRV